MQGHAGVGHPIPDPAPHDSAQDQFDDGGRVEYDEHAGSAPLPFVPQDISHRRVEFDRRKLGDTREQLATGRLPL